MGSGPRGPTGTTKPAGSFSSSIYSHVNTVSHVGDIDMAMAIEDNRCFLWKQLGVKLAGIYDSETNQYNMIRGKYSTLYCALLWDYSLSNGNVTVRDRLSLI